MTDARGLGAGRLARLGFADPERAAGWIAQLQPGEPVEAIVASAAKAADPEQALNGLVGVLEGLDARDADDTDRAELSAAIARDEELRDRLLGVLGASAGLAEHLRRHPEHWRELADPQLTTVRPAAWALRAEMLAAVERADNPVDAIRVEYRRLLLRLSARDLAGGAGNLQVDDVAAELADLAAAALDAALAIATAALPADAAPVRLAIIGMGKTGGRELNYVSDVDVIFIAEPASDSGSEDAALRTATRLAAHVIRACSDHTVEGTLWPVDAALRPEGRNGPLVRTVKSHLTYYQRWAKTWEFQALLKARPIAGDLELGAEFADAVAPMVWQAAGRDGFVEDVQAMRRRVVDHIPAGSADRELKLGPGGLRDVEFAVQLLQLVHGRSDTALRSPSTLVALEALTAGGYVGRADGAALAEAYRFLRSMEHRIQLSKLRRTHLLPTDERELRALGRSLGFMKDSIAELNKEWRRHAREVRRLHEKLFYRPLLAAVARLPSEELRLTPEAARARLAALGYHDAAAALKHLESLTSGVSRRAAIQRTLLPVLLGWFGDGPDPDAGLLAFRQVSDTLGTTPWYLRLLRDESLTAERMARLLASSRYVVDLIRRAPETIAMLGHDEELAPRSGSLLEAEMLAAARRHDDPVEAIAGVRAVRRRELFRVAAADLLGLLEVDAVGLALTEIAAATVSGGLEAARRAIEAERRAPLPTRVAVVAMGRFGGYEMGYGSDADVLFVHEPYPEAEERAATDAALSVVAELRRLLAVPGTDPPLAIDADLRPEGRQGPLIRTLASYAAYYEKWSSPWEAQALLRAHPVAGDEGLRSRFEELIAPLRRPPGGVSDDDVREIRRIKARVEAERLPRGADPATHTKLGRGGLADIEWTVQLLQLRHGARIEGLRTTMTGPALRAAAEAGLLSPDDAEALIEAWRIATRIRNAIMLVRARASDQLPRDPRELSVVARVLGYGPQEAGRLLDDYRRLTRHARAIVDEVFWGWAP
ncbi:bifunctional [glutamine synthetase] adenylyltransferase/[glutamine synthetase]-adenylyl-L-tyrosine phosphorylase [Flindersiella endophytica]